MRVIDIHTHPVFRGLNLFGQPTDLNRVIAHGRRHNVVHMIVLGDVLLFGVNPNIEQLRKINNDTIKVVKARPDYFTGFVYLNPLLGERATLAETERCLKTPGFRGIKLEVANNAAHPAMRHVAKAARTFNLPVLQHSWSTTNIKDRKHQSDPVDTALFARRNPEVKVIMAHLTGIGFRGVLEAKGLPNLYIDTSGGYPEEYLLEFAAEHIGADHILYGSDVPIRENSCTIGRIIGTKLSAADKHRILFGNAARLLNLKLT